MTLFISGNFTLHSGKSSNFKIDCDGLDHIDYKALADIVVPKLPYNFSTVYGIPKGGVRFALALSKYCRPCNNLLIVDDVLTTGGSMEEAKKLHQYDGHHTKYDHIFGLVVFARNQPADWIFSIFQMPDWIKC